MNLGASDRVVMIRSSAYAAILCAMAVVYAGPAIADSPGCKASPNTAHCYSIVSVTDHTRYGVYGVWNRAEMDAGGANSTNRRFIDSEMWAINISSGGWIETGHTAGWLAPANDNGYHAYAAWNTAGGTYSEYNFGARSANDNVTDEFQITRATTTDKWRIYFDGA